jgi:hypothetical protein
MRALLVLALLGGCLGGGGGSRSSGANGATRPGVMPMLSELPADPAKRNAVLDSANATAGPEQRKGMTAKERKAETAAATAAAIIGSMFSSTQSVTLGTASQFNENELIAPLPPPLPATGSADEAKPGTAAKPGAPAKPDAPPADSASNADLIPWIKLK